MKKNVINPLNALALFVVVFGLVFITSCSDDEPGAEEEEQPTETTGEIIRGDAELSQFAEFVDGDQELKALVDGSAEFSVFAPTNEAFEVLKTSLGVDDLNSISASVIGAVLRFHFVSGTVRTEDLGSSLTTEQSEQIVFNSDGTISTGGSNTNVGIVGEEKLATNGVVHKVERILIPPTLFVQIGTNLGTLAQPVLLGAAFTDVVSIIAVADADVPAGEQSIAGILANRDSTLTVFLPVNDVFTAVAGAQGIDKTDLLANITSSSAAARGFLLNHIYAEEQLTGAEIEAAAGTTITMATGTTLMINASEPSEQNPLGIALVNVADQTKVAPVFDLDVFKAVIPEDPTDPNNTNTITLDGAINGSLHVSSIIQ